MTTALTSRWVTGDTHLTCMLALTFSTGIADVVGYLGLDRVFTGNMTGNVVILGMALGGGDGLPVVGPAIALTAFMAGAAVAGRVLHRQRTPWPPRVTMLFTAVTAMFTVCGILLLVADTRDVQEIVTGLLAAASGVQAVAARNVAVKDVTTVVVTSTIAGLAADSAVAGGNSQPWKRRIGVVVLIGCGALVGALLLNLHIAAAVFLSALLTGSVTAAGSRWGGSPARAHTPK